MKSPRHVLAYVTTTAADDPALVRAASLARSTGARVTVAAVLAPEGTLPPTWRIQRRIDELDRQICFLRERGVHADFRVAIGQPAPELIRIVRSDQVDLVIKTASAGDFERRIIFGSTGMKLLRECPCPVWVARREDRPTIRRILAAVDLPVPGTSAASLVDDVLHAARTLALRDGAELHLAHAFRPVGEGLLMSRGRGGSAAIADRYVAAMRARRARELRALATAHGIEHATIHVQRGSPDVWIPTVAEHLDVDLAIVGAAGRSGIAGLVVGNTVERLLPAIPTAILAVRPRGDAMTRFEACAS